MMERCIICGRELVQNEMAATKKLINRNTREYMCVHCLAEKFGVTEEVIHEKILQFKKNGCTLFV